jgi:hypothetical protein
MSVIRGEVLAFEQKTWPDGNTSDRIQLRGDNGATSWFTSYADQRVFKGTRILAEIKTSKAGKDYINSFQIEGEGEAVPEAPPQYTPPPQSPAQSPSVAPSVDMRQLSIEMQVFWKELTTLDGMAPLDALHHAYGLAFKSQEIAAAYAKGGAEAARRVVKQQTPGTVENKAAELEKQQRAKAMAEAEAEIAERNNSASTDVGNPDSQDFDDDIPF